MLKKVTKRCTISIFSFFNYWFFPQTFSFAILWFFFLLLAQNEPHTSLVLLIFTVFSPCMWVIIQDNTHLKEHTVKTNHTDTHLFLFHSFLNNHIHSKYFSIYLPCNDRNRWQQHEGSCSFRTHHLMFPLFFSLHLVEALLNTSLFSISPGFKMYDVSCAENTWRWISPCCARLSSNDHFNKISVWENHIWKMNPHALHVKDEHVKNMQKNPCKNKWIMWKRINEINHMWRN